MCELAKICIYAMLTVLTLQHHMLLWTFQVNGLHVHELVGSEL